MASVGGNWDEPYGSLSIVMLLILLLLLLAGQHSWAADVVEDEAAC
jgi:hypothetical protein